MGEFEHEPNWTELENDPRFLEELLLELQIRIPEKKFGEELWWKHRQLSGRRAMEDQQGNFRRPETTEDFAKAMAASSESPLIPEMGQLEKDLEQADTLEKMLVVANKHGVEITSEEMHEAKKGALRGVLGME